MKNDTLLTENTVFDYTQTMPDRFNPFNNDTENYSARNDYRKIVPQISVKDCIIPLKPSKYEKSNIKSIYNKTSIVLLLHLIVSNILAGILSFIILLIGGDISSSSSVSISIVAIIYTITNIGAFLLGCKLLNIPIKSVFNKPNATTKDMLKHISISWCFQGACMIIVTLLYSIFYTIGVDLMPNSALDSSNYTSITYTVATFLYTCIIAPITEEMLFRGVILRGFSVVSQRFGIFMSALLFGLLHGNILQFITTFTIGIYLGFVATKYNSILPTIVMHFFINLAPTLMEMTLSNNEIVYSIVTYGFYGIMISIGILLICLGFRKKSNRLPIQNEYQKSRTLPIAMSSLGVLTILVMYILSMILNHAMSSMQ